MPVIQSLHTKVPHSDAELARRACDDNDRWAKEMLYRRHADRLVAIAMRLLANKSDAEDAVQDAFINAFRDLAKLRDRARVDRWLTRITLRQVHRRFRRRKLLRVLGLGHNSEDQCGLVELASPDLSPDMRTELALLDRVLATLPAKHKVPWMLRHVEGYTLDEVAAACACSLATAKRHIKRAHQVIMQHAKMEELSDE